MMKRFLLVCVFVALFVSCATTGGYKPVATPLPQIKVSFADPAWNGKTLPPGQQCSFFGGKGSTPSLIVENISAQANAIIVEFNDRDDAPLSSDGGHGKIGFWIKPGPKAILPPVPGETASVPEGTFIEADSQSTGRYATRGYLPPCSGGKGNRYFADVKAVYKAKSRNEQSLLLAVGKIELGRY